MKHCPTCNRTYPDSLRFCRKDGEPLAVSNEQQINSLNFKTTAPLCKPTNVISKPEIKDSPEWNLFYLGMGLCLISGVSIAILNEPNTKKLLRDNAIRGNEIVIALFVLIFIIGACMSLKNCKKALHSGQQRKAP